MYDQGHLSIPVYTPAEIEQIVRMIRLNLYNRGLPCGAQVIRLELAQEGVRPLPSLSTINRILSRLGLTHGRTGHYEPKSAPKSFHSITSKMDLMGIRQPKEVKHD